MGCARARRPPSLRVFDAGGGTGRSELADSPEETGFDPQKIAAYTAADVRRLIEDPRIIRNRLKIESAIKNARGSLRVIDEFGSFDAFIWRYVDYQPRQNAWRSSAEVPARTGESDAMSKDLIKRGFTFVGSTICYAFMQAVGMVNDHVVGCFRHDEVKRAAQPGGCLPHR